MLLRPICKEVGPGISGSYQERERAAIIKKELESHLGAGNVIMEEFTLAPKAFLSPYPGVPFLILAALLNISIGGLPGIPTWLTASAAVVFSILMPLLFILEFIFGLEVIDPFFKKKTSVNVIGTLRCPGTQNVKRVLLLGGHHDSAPENTWLRFLGYGFFAYSGIFFIGVITMLVMSHNPVDRGDPWQCTKSFAPEPWDGFCWPFLIVPSIIFVWFSNPGMEKRRQCTRRGG